MEKKIIKKIISMAKLCMVLYYQIDCSILYIISSKNEISAL